MGYFSELDIIVREMIADGATRNQVQDRFPVLREDEVDAYFNEDFDDEERDPAEYDYQYDDSMDGDAESALASAGYGTDEDYGYYGDEY